MKYFIRSNNYKEAENLMKRFREILMESKELKSCNMQNHRIHTTDDDEYVFCRNDDIDMLTRGIRDMHIYSSTIFDLLMNVYLSQRGGKVNE